MADDGDKGPTIPRSTDEENSAIEENSVEGARKPATDNRESDDDPRYGGNPPHTTRGNFTAPKFGSAGSGGAEFEPGPERD
jgi:hypothetical protein